MKIEELTFPLTLEAFMAFQKEGRALHESWDSLLEALVPEINAAYECDDPDELRAALRRLDEGIAEFEGNPQSQGVLRFTKNWFVYAYNRGRADAEKAVMV